MPADHVPPASPGGRVLALVVLVAIAAIGVAVALGRGERAPGVGPRLRRLAADWRILLLAAAGIRLALSLCVDGGIYDVFNAYRIVGGRLASGQDVFVPPSLSLANYAPLIYWWWGAASAIPVEHPDLYAGVVRAPFWLADAAIAVALLRWAPPRSRVAAGWLYALSPVAAAVPTLHGQFEPLVLLPLLAALVVLRERPALAGLLLGMAIAVKPWPVYFIPVLLVHVPRRDWPRLLGAAAAVPAACFALYGAWHPQHVVEGMVRVLTYTAHRQGFGTGVLFPDGYSVVGVTAANLVAGALCLLAGVTAARRGRSPAEAVAVAMLVLLALAPTVSDQYLMWPLALLLAAGRLRAVALLGAALLPAVASVDLLTSQNLAPTPAALFLLASVAMAATAAALLLRPPPVPAVAPELVAAPAA